GGSEDAERAAGPVQLFGQALVVDPADPLDIRRAVVQEPLLLSAPDQPDADLRRGARGAEDGRQAVERDQLADEQACKRLLGCPAGAEEALLGADEADLESLGGEPCELGQVT